VKDPVFEAEDLETALQQATFSTGLARETLRYVVLEPGSAAGPGQPGRSTRIAVLLGAAPAASPQASAAAPAAPRPGASDPTLEIDALLRALGKAAGLPLEAEWTPGPETCLLKLSGADQFLLQDDAEPLRALEHLLQRVAGDRLEGRLVLDVAGYRGAREAQIQSQARAWAEEVRRSGQPRETPPMNAYDRRLVHLALAGDTDLRTFSVGEGARRRVTIAPASEAP